MPNKKQFNGGLRPTPRDRRDFSFSKVFGTIAPPTEDFLVGESLEIKDQFDSDMCAAFAGCTVSELQESVRLSPEFQFALIKAIEGNPYTWGTDLRTATKSFVQIGSVEQRELPADYTLKDKDRDFLAQIENWGNLIELEMRAGKHQKESYFKVDESGYKDVFDALRSALWINRNEKRGILTGTAWRPNWTDAPDGIIPSEYEDYGFGHAFALIGQKRINNELYLVAQLSNGTDIGDKGYFYFSREITNKEFKYGAYTFKDMPSDKAKQMCWTFWIKVYNAFRKYLEAIIK